MDTLLTPQQIAEICGVPVKTVYQWNYAGTGPRPIRVGRHVRYRPSDLTSWLDANSAEREPVA